VAEETAETRLADAGATLEPDAVSEEAEPVVGRREAGSLVHPDHFYSRVFAVTATAVLGIALYKIVLPFIGPLMWALFIAFLLHPLHVRISRQLRDRQNLSAAILTFATFVMLVGPLAALSAAFVSQAIELVQWVQETFGKQSHQPLANLPIIGPIVQWLRESFGIRTNQLQGWIAQGAQTLPALLAGLGGRIFLGAINTVLAFVIMLFVLFFCVRDGAKLFAMMRDLVPMTPLRREQLMDHLAAVTRAVVFGTGMTALIQGTLVGIAFLLTGLNSPLVFGVLAALLALLPIGGTALVWLPALIFLVIEEHWGLAIVMLAFGLLSSTIDNILRPLLISGRAEVSTLTIFIGVLGGVTAFGPIGLFLGPVLLALIIALLRFALEVRRGLEHSNSEVANE
jgi:predicted PurR-regulated permease PerM